MQRVRPRSGHIDPPLGRNPGQSQATALPSGFGDSGREEASVGSRLETNWATGQAGVGGAVQQEVGPEEVFRTGGHLQPF